MCVPEGVVSLIDGVSAIPAMMVGWLTVVRLGVVDGIARATLDDSWVSPLLLVIDLLNTPYLYGH